MNDIYVKMPHKPICGCNLVMTCKIHSKTGVIAEVDDLRAERDRYKAALEEINRLPGGSTVEELSEIRFQAVNISFKALTDEGAKRIK